jgi:hypothetical protein
MRGAAIAGLLAIGTSALAENSAEDVKTTVKIYVLRNVSDRKLNVSWAQNTASQIFAEAGVRVKWQLGEPRRGEPYLPIIINLTSDTPKTLAPGALACAQVYEGVHIKVFWDRVQNTVRGANPAATFLLAHVMAHEIAHVLERVNRHSETGLMKASWTQTEIEQMSVRPLLLAPEDVQLIHIGLLNRVPQQAAAHIDCG